MKALLLGVTSLAVVFLSATVNSATHKSAVITDYDLEKRVISLDGQKYLISDKTRIVIDGKSATMADLKEAQSVQGVRS
jgi:hypothetical protein